MFNTKEKEMKRAIDEAWQNPTKEQQQFQDKYFPNGKPTVEEFVKKMSEIICEARSI